MFTMLMKLLPLRQGHGSEQIRFTHCKWRWNEVMSQRLLASIVAFLFYYFKLSLSLPYPKYNLKCYSSLTKPDEKLICPESRYMFYCDKIALSWMVNLFPLSFTEINGASKKFQIHRKLYVVILNITGTSSNLDNANLRNAPMNANPGNINSPTTAKYTPGMFIAVAIRTTAMVRIPTILFPNKHILSSRGRELLFSEFSSYPSVFLYFSVYSSLK